MNEFQKNKPIYQKSTTEIYEELKFIENHIGESFLDLSKKPIEEKLVIDPDSSIAPATFRPDPTNPHRYFAHPDTIRAVRKEIFISDDEFLDRSKSYICQSCKNELDLQFWLYCPFCGEKFHE